MGKMFARQAVKPKRMDKQKKKIQKKRQQNEWIKDKRAMANVVIFMCENKHSPLAKMPHAFVECVIAIGPTNWNRFLYNKYNKITMNYLV